MDNILFWNDINDMYCTITGVVLITSGYLLAKSFWKWWKEIKDKKPSVSQSNALQGFCGGIVLFLVGIMLLYYSFILPLMGWLKH
ncbi:hypothetical protein [Flavobacterium sp. HJSW_4]|uniref:hypothetical protein n=1 Tax=Flavobacterium sp. HJSW_4 TaxID=3344660 RepID=UPI0035F25E43